MLRAKEQVAHCTRHASAFRFIENLASFSVNDFFISILIMGGGLRTVSITVTRTGRDFREGCVKISRFSSMVNTSRSPHRAPRRSNDNAIIHSEFIFIESPRLCMQYLNMRIRFNFIRDFEIDFKRSNSVKYYLKVLKATTSYFVL